MLLQFRYIGVRIPLTGFSHSKINLPPTTETLCQLFKDKFNRTVNCHLKKMSTCLPGARRLNPGSGSSWKSLHCCSATNSCSPSASLQQYQMCGSTDESNKLTLDSAQPLLCVKQDFLLQRGFAVSVLMSKG